MAETDRVRVATESRGVATLTLTRAKKRNAMDAAMIDALAGAAERLAADRAVRVVVLAAEGEVFCAGGDLGWMQAQAGAERAGRIREARRLADMLGALDRLSKPLIARVQGDAFGGGLGLLSVADAAIGADAARFALTETRLGLIPATIGPYVLARLGPAAGRRMFCSPRPIGAAEACRIGLLAEAVPPEGLDAAVEAEVAPYLTAAPGAIAAGKALARQLAGRVDAAAVEASVAALADRWETEEAAAGIAAFFAKTSPPWRAG